MSYCKKPPPGWWCSRDENHKGPCAARKVGPHINKDGLFQSDKYPTCPPGKFPMSLRDPKAQPLIWEYAEGHTADPELAEDLKAALWREGFVPLPRTNEQLALHAARVYQTALEHIRRILRMKGSAEAKLSSIGAALDAGLGK